MPSIASRDEVLVSRALSNSNPFAMACDVAIMPKPEDGNNLVNLASGSSYPVSPVTYNADGSVTASVNNQKVTLAEVPSIDLTANSMIYFLDIADYKSHYATQGSFFFDLSNGRGVDITLFGYSQLRLWFRHNYNLSNFVNHMFSDVSAPLKAILWWDHLTKTRRLFLNGAEVDEFRQTSTVTNSSMTRTPIVSIGGTSTNFNSSYRLVLPDGLTEAEALSLVTDPYQVFELPPSEGTNFDLTPVVVEQITESVVNDVNLLNELQPFMVEQRSEVFAAGVLINSELAPVTAEQHSEVISNQVSINSLLESTQVEQVTEVVVTDLNMVSALAPVYLEQRTEAISGDLTISSANTVLLEPVTVEQRTEVLVSDVLINQLLQPVLTEQITEAGIINLAGHIEFSSVVVEQHTETVIANLSVINENAQFLLDGSHIRIIKTTPIIKPILTTPIIKVIKV